MHFIKGLEAHRHLKTVKAGKCTEVLSLAAAGLDGELPYQVSCTVQLPMKQEIKWQHLLEALYGNAAKAGGELQEFP
jgi:hypothetical protein